MTKCMHGMYIPQGYTDQDICVICKGLPLSTAEAEPIEVDIVVDLDELESRLEEANGNPA